MFTYINKRFGTLFRLWWGQCYPTSTHIRALLSRSSREMKFNSSSWYVKAGLLRFWDNVRVFLQTAHCVKSRAHSPRRQNNRDDSFKKRHFDEGRPCGEPPCTSLVQRSCMLMHKRPLFPVQQVHEEIWQGNKSAFNVITYLFYVIEVLVLPAHRLLTGDRCIVWSHVTAFLFLFIYLFFN